MQLRSGDRTDSLTLHSQLPGEGTQEPTDYGSHRGVKVRIGRKVREWGVGSGEWGVGSGVEECADGEHEEEHNDEA